jgi:acyl carrier protein
MGRNDRQVKIRGFRIELEEVEAQIARHVSLREVIVVAREDVPREKRLVAYLVRRPDDTAIEIEQLRSRLKASVPEYMVPSAFVCLEQLPLTANGKVDLRSLPAPELDAYVSREYEAPRGEIEEVVAELWRELLRVERVGRQDQFFDLGGHSLLATRLLARLRERLQVDVPLRALFEAPTVAQLAARLATARVGKAIAEASDADALAQDLRRRIGEMQDDAVLARIAELEKELGRAKHG